MAGSDLRSSILGHRSSGGCEMRESEAKKRLGFVTEKDCLLVEVFLITFSLQPYES